MISLSVLASPYLLTADDSDVEERLGLLLSGFRAETAEPASRAITIAGGRMRGLGPETVFESADDLIVEAENRILRDALERSERIALHGAAILRNGRLTLLVGPSGAGKTTLTLALNAAGCDYLSDEVAPVDTETGTVCAFPRSPAASTETVGLLGIDLDDTPHVRIAGAVCFPPTPPSTTAEHPVDDVIFLARGRASSIEPIPRADGLTALLAVAADSDRTRAFRCFGRIAERARFYRARNGVVTRTRDQILGLE